MPVRKLSDALQKIAENELNENPQRLQEDINHIREWISKQPHLKCRTDDQWLVCFLRSAKFSLERTKEKIDFFYTVRTLLPEIFDNRDPYLPEIQRVLNKGIAFPLPNTLDKDKFRVAVVKAGDAHPDEITILTAVKIFTMYQDVLMLEDDNFSVSGHLIFFFLQNISLKFITQLTPGFVKKIACIYQSYPSRFIGAHIINPPSFTEHIVKFVKSITKEKLFQRIKFCTTRGNSYDISNIISKEILPVEFGGNDGNINEIARYWKSKLENHRDWFMEDSQYRNDETKRVGLPKTSADIFGVEGSFRKLNID